MPFYLIPWSSFSVMTILEWFEGDSCETLTTTRSAYGIDPAILSRIRKKIRFFIGLLPDFARLRCLPADLITHCVLELGRTFLAPVRFYNDRMVQSFFSS